MQNFSKDKNVSVAVYKDIFSSSLFKNDGTNICYNPNFYTSVENLLSTNNELENYFNNLIYDASILNNVLNKKMLFNSCDMVICYMDKIINCYIEFGNILEEIMSQVDKFIADHNKTKLVKNEFTNQLNLLNNNKVYFINLGSKLCNVLKTSSKVFENSVSINDILQNPTEDIKTYFIKSLDNLEKFNSSTTNTIYYLDHQNNKLAKKAELLIDTYGTNAILEYNLGNIEDKKFVNTAFRTQIPVEIANMFGFECMNTSEVAITPDGYCIVMDRVNANSIQRQLTENKSTYESYESDLDFLKNQGKPRFSLNKEFIESAIEMGILDYVLLEIDRHTENYFLSSETQKITAIDNGSILSVDKKFIRNNQIKDINTAEHILFAKVPFVTQYTKIAIEKIDLGIFERFLKFAFVTQGNSDKNIDSAVERLKFLKKQVNDGTISLIDLSDLKCVKEKINLAVRYSFLCTKNLKYKQRELYTNPFYHIKKDFDFIFSYDEFKLKRKEILNLESTSIESFYSYYSEDSISGSNFVGNCPKLLNSSDEEYSFDEDLK